MEEYKKTNSSPVSPEEKTHTTALIFLVLAVLIIVFIILTYRGDLTSTDQPDRSATSTEQSDGTIIPVDDVATAAAEDTADLPDGLYINDAAIEHNTTADFSAERTQRTVVFADEQARSDLAEQYRDWISDSSFELSVDQANDSSTTLVASSGDDQLTVAIMDTESGSRVQLNYITPGN